MPWYKLFDEKSQNWDGVVRYNVDANGNMWFPTWVYNGAQLTQEMVNRALQMGPYY